MNFKIKELEWHEVVGAEGHIWCAETPAAARNLNIYYEEGRYWPTWGPDPGQETLEEAQRLGQEYHNDYVEKFLSKFLVFD